MRINFPLYLATQDDEKDKRLVREHSRGISLFSLLPVLWWSAFFILPFLIVLKTSFCSSTFSVPPVSSICSVGNEELLTIQLNFGNYSKLATNPSYRGILMNSLAIAVSATIVCLIIGYIMAYGMSRAKTKMKSFLILLISGSFWTSSIIRAYSWMHILSMISSKNCDCAANTCNCHLSIQLLGNKYSLCVALVFCYLPLMVLPIYSIMEKIGNDYFEASLNLGARAWQTFWNVTVPLTKRGIISGCFLVFSSSISELIIPELFGGEGAVTMGRVLWQEFFHNIDWPTACTIAIVTMLIVVPLFHIAEKK